MKSLLKSTLVILLFFSFQPLNAQSNAEIIENVTVVKLSQTPGKYETTQLNLPPGKYIFEVSNKNVNKGLGFWLTPKGEGKNQISNSGLSKLVKKGETARTGVVVLAEGNYEYSCPLNPTPHYNLTVSAKTED